MLPLNLTIGRLFNVILKLKHLNGLLLVAIGI